MRHCKEEKGSALLIVLFMIIVFTLLGLAVLSASIGGATRSQTKLKDVQSLHLAEKALNEAVARIKATLDDKDDIDPDKIGEQLTEMFPALTENEVETEFLIKPITEVSLDTSSGTPQIKIIVTANIDGVKRKLEQNVGINVFPDVLNYAAGSEGDLILNGSPYFRGGDLYAGKKLKIKNQAEYIYNNENGFKSLANVGRYSQLEGRAFVQSLDNFVYCNSKVTPYCGDTPSQADFISINETTDKGMTTIPRVLGIDKDQVELKSKDDFVELNMDESFIDKVTESLSGNNFERLDISKEYKKGSLSFKDYLKARTDKLQHPVIEELATYTEEQRKVYLNQREKDIKFINERELPQQSYLYNGNFKMGSGEEIKQLVFSEEAKSTRVPVTPGANYYTSYWFIINGNLEIENTDTYPLKVKGNILVTGDVNIKGNVQMDATIFSLGSTNILDASITGLPDLKGDPKELVLLSKGEILISRVNSFKPLPMGGYDPDKVTNDSITRLDAFFYTDSYAELYGVGSVFWIRGGFFAKNDLTINAVRGNTIESADLTALLVPPGQENLNEKQSRFIIEYNKDIFTHQLSSLPRVKGINLYRGKKVLVK
ncbi:hypothetical protein GCM10008018_38080 [Paenibacillus marchantiophytorum]|uniref:Type II secretion system protein n=1 Tax=Paenibacillus marchantiophytorum TaxID=1619310 RepID=A0ABQ1EVV1_9BACL|nr:hypothetical protein [Paenibacillus marchantiophytorum]GFZ88308.1 hypothetical protein GCM10008018_38080 [Paenibacillus marchantiophytorum]